MELGACAIKRSHRLKHRFSPLTANLIHPIFVRSSHHSWPRDVAFSENGYFQHCRAQHNRTQPNIVSGPYMDFLDSSGTVISTVRSRMLFYGHHHINYLYPTPYADQNGPAYCTFGTYRFYRLRWLRSAKFSAAGICQTWVHTRCWLPSNVFLVWRYYCSWKLDKCRYCCQPTYRHSFPAPLFRLQHEMVFNRIRIVELVYGRSLRSSFLLRSSCCSRHYFDGYLWCGKSDQWPAIYCLASFE